MDTFAGKKTSSNFNIFPIIFGFFLPFSIADDKNKVERTIEKFGKDFGPLIQTIINQDCSKFNQRYKRTTISTKRKNFPRIFLRHMIDRYKSY